MLKIDVRLNIDTCEHIFNIENSKKLKRKITVRYITFDISSLDDLIYYIFVYIYIYVYVYNLYR